MSPIVMTVVYTVLTIIILFLIKLCKDKRKELKKIKEENEQKHRIKAQLEDAEPLSERELQEKELRELIARGKKNSENEGLSKFDE